MIAQAPLKGMCIAANEKKVQAMILVLNKLMDKYQDGRRDVLALQAYGAREGNATRRVGNAHYIQSFLHYKWIKHYPPVCSLTFFECLQSSKKVAINISNGSSIMLA